MKTTLFLSTIAAGLLAATTTFAQNFGGYPQAYGDAAASRNAAPYWGAPTYNRFTRSDLGYQSRAAAPRSQVRSRGLAPVVAEPAPAQEQ